MGSRPARKTIRKNPTAAGNLWLCSLYLEEEEEEKERTCTFLIDLQNMPYIQSELKIKTETADNLGLVSHR